MSTTARRSFLKGAGLSAAAWALHTETARAAEPRQVTVAVIGTGGMGSSHVRNLSVRKDVRLAYVCDVDKNRLSAAAQIVESATGAAPKTVKDMRRVLDDKSVDAVWIATPDHWHAPAAILALDAGKHVYVEKPCCHNIREGRLMVEAVAPLRQALAGRHAEPQHRLCPRGDRAASRRRDRRGAGRQGLEQPAPRLDRQVASRATRRRHLDFDLWVGPAPMVPYRSNLLPGIWRWWYDFGCGDIGNDGVHDIDVACWGLGVTTHPSHGRLPGRQVLLRRRPAVPRHAVRRLRVRRRRTPGRPKQLIFEQRIWSPYVQEGYENGAAFYGTEGLLIIGHTVGWKLYGAAEQADRRADRRGRPAGPPHELPRLHPRHAVRSSTPT